MGKMSDVCRIDDKELNRVLNNFNRYSVQAQEGITKAVKTATQSIGRTARRLAPFNPLRAKGTHLNKTIKTSVKKANSQHTVYGVVKTAAPHAHLMEFGVKPHTIIPKRKKVLVIMANGIGRFVAGAKHPGISARPFMAPAFNQNKGKFISDVKAAIK